MTKPSKPSKQPRPSQDAITAYGIDALCLDISGGKSLTLIAHDLGVGIARLIAWIAATPEHSARVREARIATAQLWDEKAERTIEQATDPLELGKARELASHYRWRASKIAPKDYGDKQQIDHGGAVTLIAQMSPEERELRALALAQKAATLIESDG